jgi:3-dehydroquinate synthase
VLLEADGGAIARGDEAAWASGAVAELVEHCLWAKVEVVLADERETAEPAAGGVGRIALNLGHTVGHGLEAAAGFGGLLHGEAVAYGLRAACRIGAQLGVTPVDRSARVERLLDALGLAIEPLEVDPDVVLEAMGTDKKPASGTLRWVLPTGDSVTVRTDVAAELVGRVVDSVIAGPSDGDSRGAER